MSPSPEEATGFRLAVLVEGGLGIIAVLLAWLFGIPLREQFAATASQAVWAAMRGVVATLPLLAMFWWLVHAPWPSAQRLRNQVQPLVHEIFPGAPLGQLAFVAVLAGISEELLFRGVLQTLVGFWTTPLVGLAAASLVFGLFHAMSQLYFVLATLVGAYLGWLVFRFNDLISPIVAHALYDFLALVYLTSNPEKEVRDERSGD